MKYHYIVTALLLSGCVAPVPPATPYQVNDDLNRAFSGDPVNRFFYKFGQPAGEFESGDGHHIYRWTSVRGRFSDAPISTWQAPTGTYRLVDTYSGKVETEYCEVRVYTDSQGFIDHFEVAVDSIGRWSSSRCSEIFEYPNS